MTEIKHHTIHANNIRQHYMEAGEGVPVVLLHGFPETSYAWRHQIPELAKSKNIFLTGYEKLTVGQDFELRKAVRVCGHFPSERGCHQAHLAGAA